MNNKEYKRKDGKNAKKYERTVTTKKICPICGEEFEARTWNRKTCYKRDCEIANVIQIAKNREERYKSGEYCSILKNREFTCERCNKVFIKHTTNRKKFRFCDECVNQIKEETYIYCKIQETGTAANIIGSGGNQEGAKNPNWKGGITKERDYKSKFRGPNECYFCGRINSVDIHHLDTNHDNNDKKNLIQLCRSCHKRLHYIYKRLEKLGIIFPNSN